MKLFKHSFGLLVVATVLAFSSCGSSNEEVVEEKSKIVTDLEGVVYVIDSGTSEIEWTGNMLGMYSHSGKLKVLSGNIIVNGETIVGGEVVVDMTSITPTDNGYNAEKTKEMLVDHLSSDDFFDVSNHPTATIKLLGDDKGVLTIRGKSEKVGFSSEYDRNVVDGVFIAKGRFDFNRKTFGVSFDHPVKENVISDQVDLVFILNAREQAL